MLKLSSTEEVLELRKIETFQVSKLPEPEAPQEAEPEEIEAEIPPPAPSFDDLRPSVDVDALALPSSETKVPIDASVDIFSIDTAPAILNTPTKKVSNNTKPAARSRVTTSKPPATNKVGLGDLDSKPRLIRKGRVRWPSNVRSKSVKAMLQVEIDESGRIKLIRIVSIEDEELSAQVRAYVRDSRFTPPKKNGVPVRVPFNWPVTFNKP
ncbi:TonB family protein [Rubritalea tangerina]|uniref:TonB family protein n=1 Tax=Rubritalea tangerina TaxID=430798 RepID=UPI003619F8E0